MQQVLAALSTNPIEADRFVGALMSVVPVGVFFAPRNLERIVREGRTDRGRELLLTDRHDAWGDLLARKALRRPS